MEKAEYEQLMHRDGELETSRHLIQTKLANLKTSDPAILDYDATKKKLHNELNAVIQERGVIRENLERAKPLLDIQASHDVAKAIPKILISVSLDQQPKALDDEFGYDHTFQPCNHSTKRDIYDLIPDSDPNAWNALVRDLADFNGIIRCPKCVAERNSLKAQLKEKINALRARMPDATIADQDPRKTVSTARYNVHIKK
jgi:hypothetical protein